jgi:hypothetical protein
MGFPITFSVSPVGSATDQELGLRAFQRVTAQVLSVTGTTAVLEVEGVPLVAQLTSADQAAELASRGTAQFIVTQLSRQAVTLKLVKNDQPRSTQSNGGGLANQILENNNLPLTADTLTLARSLLKQHLPVTPRLLDELMGALADYGTWAEADADLAAAMKSAGLPVTAQSLTLASRQPVQTAQALSSLIATLTQALSQNLPPELRKQITASLQMLNSLVVKDSQTADQLKAAAGMLGRSLENILLEQIQHPANPIPEKSLASLAKLQKTLEQSGKQEIAQAVGEFMKDIQRSQFMNVKPDPTPGQGEWSEIGFMIQGAQQKAEGKFSSVRLRIAHEARADSSKINPGYTRLILQVDLEAGETVEVDLSLVGKQIRATLMAEDPTWRKLAQDELPFLEEALGGLGYLLGDVQIGAGDPQPVDRIQTVSGNARLLTVNIEV